MASQPQSRFEMNVESAGLAAAWSSVIITGLGLGSLILQVGAFQKLLDEFHDVRGADTLGLWIEQQASIGQRLFHVKKPPPRGPKIEGKYSDGLCGLQTLHVSRKPIGKVGTASWTSLLATLHPNSQLQPTFFRPQKSMSKLDTTTTTDLNSVVSAAPPQAPWTTRLETQDLLKHRNKACTKITRTAFVTSLALVNAYQIYKYSGAAGLRVAYSGYTGTWQVHWPIGGEAELEFFPLDSHDKPQETHPPSFPRRVDKCILMLLGIIETGGLEKLAFPEPQTEGVTMLELHPKGYLSHGKTTHLFNMLGGDCSDVEYLRRRPFNSESDGHEKASTRMLELTIPNPELDLDRKPLKSWDKRKHFSTVFVPRREQTLLAKALDCLPWSPLCWSVHHGMQCLLVAYGARIMKVYRPALARTLREAIEANPERLEALGWTSKMARRDMAHIAAASVMADGGDSGDSVRVVTAAAELIWRGKLEDLDETTFWREMAVKPVPDTPLPASTCLEPQVVVALTKLFVLGWSNELDHKLYEDLPLWMLVA